MHRIARVLFRHYWAVLCSIVAAGEMALGRWLGLVPATPVIALGLFVANRLAAEAYEREDTAAPIRHRVGGTVLAGGMVATGGAVGLGLAAVASHLVVRAGGLAAEAGTLAHADPTTLGPLFAPLAALGAAAGMGLVLDGYLRGYRALAITRLEVTLPDLPAAMDGLRLVHLSDLHLGPLAHRAALRAALDAATAEAPDLVVVTGDIVDSPATDLGLWLPELDRVRARHGVFAILGNHDGRLGMARVADAIRAHTRWRVLRDEVARVDVEGGALRLLGLEDRPTPHEADGLPALAAAVPAGEPVVLLAHHPEVFRTAAALGLPLTLAGHTHGGQLALPWAPRVNAARLLMTPYDSGTFVEGGACLHVSRGLGTSGQRLRIGAPAEITVVTLRAPAAS